ncbi:alpha/beta fold hydrolase [Knoellia sp. CPCC 206453]|uniref:alpha/beta fold hydrolase n=1 Tax=Knoellia pratensis TaxID=3404796 RepID=UPI00361112A0
MAYGPDDAPVAVLVHGWGGWWQQLAAHVQPLLAQGYRVVAYDAPSHGGSPHGRHGRTTTALEMADALDAVVRDVGGVDLVVAHSLGAMATMWAREVHGLNAGAYVFIAPGTSVPPMIDVFQGAVGMGPRTRKRLERKLIRRFENPFEAFEATRLTRNAIAAGAHSPLLVVHDAHDPEVPSAGSRALAKVWPESELVLTEGLGHRRVIWDPEVVERVAEFTASVSNFVTVVRSPPNVSSPAGR